MIAISLGWGVQSFTMAAMVALGDLPPVDVAIHADTTHESKLTYEFAKRWMAWLEAHGIKVVTVGPDDAAFYNRSRLNGKGTPPVYSLRVTDNTGYISPHFHQGDKHGQLMRSCTQRWKIAPMRRWLQKNRNGESVESWIGISLDEFRRMKPSDVKYITHRWPLIEKRMTRHDCELYLVTHGLEVPSKSACTFCPFHNTAEWRRIKKTPEDWQEAVSVDRAIRKARPPYDLFVHPSRRPLEDVDLRTDIERGQLSLWDEECSGLCGV
jgi:hypothetical protein